MIAPDPGLTSVPAAQTEPADEIAQPRPGLRRLARATADGYRSSSPAEQAAFAMTCGFALSLAGARKITYVQERRRDLPRLRGFVRKLPRAPGTNDIRVHHYLPGMAIAMTTGGAAILAGPGGIERWLSAPFGVGVGLVVDEIALLTGRNNPYWGSERFVLITCLAATSAAASMAAGFLRRGHSPSILGEKVRAVRERDGGANSDEGSPRPGRLAQAQGSAQSHLRSSRHPVG